MGTRQRGGVWRGVRFTGSVALAIGLVACSASGNGSRGIGGASGQATGGTGMPSAGSAANSSGARAGSGGGAAGMGSGMPAQDAGSSGGSGGASSVSGSGGAAAIDAGSAAPVAFRITELNLRDPHFFLGSSDITDQPFLGTSVNGSLIPGGITMDYDGDGFLDVSILPLMQPLDPAATSGGLHLIDAHCKLSDPTQCEPAPNPGLDVTFTIDNVTHGSCLEPLAGTTSGFSPAVEAPAAPCFVTTNPADVTINLGGISIAMTGAQVAASYQGSPPNQLGGLIAGFVTTTKAMQALLPDYLGPGLAGLPITNFLRDQDKDQAQSPNGEDGWWLYLSFVAKPVTYAAP